jgi:hypothetical protein
MAADSNINNAILGVYGTDANGKRRLVHRYQGGDYGLEEIAEYFQLGQPESAEGDADSVIVLSAAEVRDLKAMADAHSFDYEEGFIEMCLEMQRFAANLPGDSFQFTANF